MIYKNSLEFTRLSRLISLFLLFSALCCASQHIVLISGDEEYRSEESLPQLAKILAQRHGFTCTVLYAIDPADGAIRPDITTNIPGLEALDKADLMIILTRFRDLPDNQIKHIVDYVESGRPVIGLRTATHAFQLKSSPTYALYDWHNKATGGFGRMVLGETWINHHGEHDVQSTLGIIAPGMQNHPILRGIASGQIWGPSDVYEVRLPLPAGSQPLVLGEVLTGMHPTDPPVPGIKNHPMLPIAWTKTYKGARVFTTTMGASEDFLNDSFRRLLVNATYWTLSLESSITPTLDVRLVGDYRPTHFAFRDFSQGRKLFLSQCAGCHGENARGSGKAPGLAQNPHLSGLTSEQLSAIVRAGIPANGMPAFDLPPDDMAAIAAYVQSLNPETPAPASEQKRITWTNPKPGDWLTYNGTPTSNRFSPLQQINTGNISQLKLKWIYPLTTFGLEVTPLEADGVIYTTGHNQVLALNAASGELLWKYERPPTPKLVGDSSLGTNRGVAILNDKVFYVTDNAHLIALDRATGKLVWETPIALATQHYGGTMAPLVVKNTVVVGVSGADEGIRGLIACFHADTGKNLWRHFTVEAPEGGGSSWLTGSYDAEANTLYWPTGNPFPYSDEHNVRPGANLYTDCLLALNPDTGELKWHYQFTPHDVRDRDSTEPMVLVDTDYGGRPRKLLLHADRNGFFYVFDRINGELLLAKPFLRRIDWASEIGKDGRPKIIDPLGCPVDAANWSSTAYNPATRLYYFLALEECTGSPIGYPDQTGQRFLRALNIDTGQIAWEIPQGFPAIAKTWSGVLATAGGVVFYGKPLGGFDAVDAAAGNTLWHFPTNVRMKASPMTFLLDGKQYIAVAAGNNILCFGL